MTRTEYAALYRAMGPLYRLVRSGEATELDLQLIAAFEAIPEPAAAKAPPPRTVYDLPIAAGMWRRDAMSAERR